MIGNAQGKVAQTIHKHTRNLIMDGFLECEPFLLVILHLE
jgi:hypothetical protein